MWNMLYSYVTWYWWWLITYYNMFGISFCRSQFTSSSSSLKMFNPSVHFINYVWYSPFFSFLVQPHICKRKRPIYPKNFIFHQIGSHNLIFQILNSDIWGWWSTWNTICFVHHLSFKDMSHFAAGNFQFIKFGSMNNSEPRIIFSETRNKNKQQKRYFNLANTQITRRFHF